MSDQQDRFGGRLRALREAAGYSQEALAERAGLSAKAISALERGERKRPYPETVRRLADALGLGEDDRAGLIGLLRVAPPDAGPPPAPARQVAREGLPGEPTPLIGRDREVEVVRLLLARLDTRLLTLIGPGGVGKTRLALHVARAEAERYADGVAWIPLASLGDAALVLTAVARSVGLDRASGGDPREALRSRLRDQQMLLVIDNMEHVLGAAPDLAELLQACAGVDILTTSRAPLNVRGEQEYLVPPLELPSATQSGSLDELGESPAIRLFTWYARQKQPTFALTERNVAEVAAICRRLDGVPLALELAAARVRVLSPADLLARLDHQLPLLVGGSRDLPERQQTMRATIDWSYRLLDSAEQALFRRLSVFAGGWTLEAAEAVAAWGEIEPEAVIDLQSRLVEQSLVTVAQEEAGTRYGMLEPIRQFASGRLEDRGEAEETGLRHASSCLALAERAAVEIEGRSEQVVWLDRLARELANLRSALAWSEGAPDAAEIGLRLATALWRFWEVRGLSAEGGRWMAGAIARADDLPESRLGKALTVAGNLARNCADYALAAEYHERSLELWRRLGDRRGIARALNNLGVIARDRGDAVRTMQFCEESLELFREAGDQHGEAIALISLGMAASQMREFERSRARYGESLVLFRASGDSWHSAFMLACLARLGVRQGDSAGARRDAEESLALYRATGDPWGVALALGALGRASQAAGDLDEAAGQLVEGLRVAIEGGIERALPELLEDLAGVALARGKPERAARLGGAAEALREDIGIVATGGDAAVTDLGALREGLQAAAWAAGRALSRDEAVAEALASPDEDPPQALDRAMPTAPSTGPSGGR